MSETQQYLVARLRKKHAEGLLLWELEIGCEMSPKQSALIFEAAKGIEVLRIWPRHVRLSVRDS